MCTRCTPFGLFAGFSLGNWADRNTIKINGIGGYQPHTRLDMNYLCSVASTFSKNEILKNELLFYPNNSIYTLGDKIRYVDYTYINSKRIHNISSVSNSNYLTHILKKAQYGSTIGELANSIIEPDISFAEAEEFVNELINNQLLVSEIEPSVAGKEFTEQLIDKLKDKPNAKSVLTVFEYVISALKEIDKNIDKTAIEKFEQISKELSKLNIEFDKKHIFQTDLFIPTNSCTLDERMAKRMLKALTILNKLTPNQNNNHLNSFKDAFYKKYEEKEIPLLVALDSEMGISYSIDAKYGDINPLIDEITLPAKPPELQEIMWANQNTYLIQKYHDALAQNKNTIQIKDEELTQFNETWDDLPTTLSSIIRIVACNNTEDKIFFSSASGSSAANLLGRFCYCDKNTEQYVSEIIKKEEEFEKETIFAEIVHLPESRIGNVIQRPTFRDYEICYLSNPSVKQEFIIEPCDLMVSVKNNQLVLRSIRLNKFIIPRLTNAHNFSNNALPVYEFLCDMQTQGLRNYIGFSWGPLENWTTYLPRVEYENIILSLEQWNIKGEDKEELNKIAAIKNEEVQLAKFLSWKSKNKIKDEVYLAESDKELYLNLKNKIHIKILLNLTNKRPSFVLKEFPFDMKLPLIKNESGSYTNEIIVSFYKN
jgi:hypothetical protein